jgi:hypothetical protein
MSIILYQVPETEFYVDKGYNLCDREGTLYVYKKCTITLDDYLNSLGKSPQRRSDSPGYGNIPPPESFPLWSQMQKKWIGLNRLQYGLKDSYTYVLLSDGTVGNAPGSGPGSTLYCESEWADRNKRSASVSEPRAKLINTANVNERIRVPRSLPVKRAPGSVASFIEGLGLGLRL